MSKIKEIRLSVDESRIKECFEPYKAWAMNPHNKKDVHWTHKELDEEQWSWGDKYHKVGVCERSMELVYYVQFFDGSNDRYKESTMNFTSKRNLYKNLVKQVSETIIELESDKHKHEIVKVDMVSLILPEGNDDWDWCDIYKS